jgi:hypothetical protein
MLTYQWRVLSAKIGSSSAVSLDDAYMVENVKKQLVWAESEGARQGTKGGDGVASALLIIIRHAMLPAYHLYVVYIVQSNIYDDTDDLTTLRLCSVPQKIHCANKRFPVTSNLRYMHGVLNVDEIKN